MKHFWKIALAAAAWYTAGAAALAQYPNTGYGTRSGTPSYSGRYQPAGTYQGAAPGDVPIPDEDSPSNPMPMTGEGNAAADTDQGKPASDKKPDVKPEEDKKPDDKKPEEKKPEEKKPEEEDYVVGSDLSLTPKWNHGLELQSKNKDFRLHVGGRTQIDSTWYSGSGNIENDIAAGGEGPLVDSTNFRRGRFRVDGVMHEVIEFACEYDFFNEIDINPNPTLTPPQTNPGPVPVPTDLWISLNQTPIGNIRLGNQKDAFGFEHLSSSRYLNFMERSFNQDTFYGPFNNGFIPGVQLTNTAMDDHMTYAIGEFKNVNNIFANGIGDGEYMSVGRVTYLPFYQDEGRYLVHVGMAGRYMALDEDQIRFRSRGNLRSGSPSSFNPVFANTGNMFGDDEYQLGLELVSIWGPWTLQSEWTGAYVTDAVTLPGQALGSGQQPAPGSNLGTYFSQGAYIEALYFLTGEHRAYNRKTGNLDRVVPHDNFFWVKTACGNAFSKGAWQLGARYAYLDLDDSGLNGGQLQSVTWGLNWFLNPNMKIQWNYDITARDFINIANRDGGGSVYGFGMRCAFDF